MVSPCDCMVIQLSALSLVNTIAIIIVHNNIIIENGNVLFFQLQFGTYLPTFRLDALAILEHLAETSEDKFQLLPYHG